MKAIIIPTLNEEENIEKLIHSIYRFVDPKDTIVLVVDDDSKDDTQEIVKSLTSQYSNLRLIIRTNEKGLSTAVKRGASELEVGPVLTMDADFSHHPRYLPAMFSKLDDGYDVVVGSRYVGGGGIIGWSGSRIAVSKIATLIARIFLRVQVKDPMSGFVGCNSPDILVKGIKHANYKFLIEILHVNPHSRVGEVPITFQDRLWGESKLGTKTIVRYLELVLRLFIEPYRE